MLSNVSDCIDDNGDDFLSDDRFANNSGVELKYFMRQHTKCFRGRGQMPIRIMTLSESKLLYPDVPHSWLCDGKLLRLLDSTHPGNYTIFQVQRKGVVSSVHLFRLSQPLPLPLYHHFCVRTNSFLGKIINVFES